MVWRSCPTPSPSQQLSSSCTLSTSPEAAARTCAAAMPLWAWPALLCSCCRLSLGSSFPGTRLQPLQPVLALHTRFSHSLLLLSAAAALSWVRSTRRRRPFLTGRWSTHTRASYGDKWQSIATELYHGISPSSACWWGTEELHTPAGMPRASGIFSIFDSSIFLWTFSRFWASGRGTVPKHGTEILRRHDKALHELCTPSPQIFLYLKLGLFQMQWEVQTQLCQGSAATERVCGWALRQAGWFSCCNLVDGQMVPSGWLTALKPVCQEPIDFPEGGQIFSLCTNTETEVICLQQEGRQLSAWFKKGWVASRHTPIWSFLSAVTHCLNN